MEIPRKERAAYTKRLFTHIRKYGTCLLAFIASALTVETSLAADHQVLPGHVPQAVQNLVPEGRLEASKRLRLSFTLPSRDPGGLKRLLDDLYDPTSPNYRRFISPQQFTKQFGPTKESYEALADFAKGHGLTVKDRHPNRLVLDVEGAVAEIERTFHVTLRTYRHPTEGRQFYAPDSDPSVDFGQPILHVSGLDNYGLPHPNSKVRPAALAHPVSGDSKSNAGSASGGSYAGNDFRSAYVPGVTLTGAGQSVGLLEFDGYYAGDITTYETQFGLPNVPLITVPIDGGVAIPGGGNGEVSLDIEMVVSLSPGVSAIYVYESSGSWEDMLNRMATDNLAKQLSCSWYIPGGAADPVAEVIFQEMAAQGQSFFAASGDSDAYTGLIPFPSDSPSITQVGGTTLTTSGPGGSFVSETVWNWGSGTGSSGGVSTNYSIPTWQQGIGMASNLGSTTMRNVPDVALTGDNVFVTYENGGSGVFGGTSCAAPLWAAFTALVNQQAAANGQPAVGFLNPAIYNVAKGATYTTNFHDVTSGNDFSPTSPSKFPAVTGFDLATGWGSPTPALIASLSGPPDPLAMSGTDLATYGPAGGPFAPGSTTYTLKNNGSSSLNWTISSTQTWLTVNPTSGTLPGGQSTTVTVSPNNAANALSLGTYNATINISDLTSGASFSRPAALSVLGPPNLSVSPAGSFQSEGNIGGPFNPQSVTYTLTNTGAPSLTWTAGNSSNWLSLSNAGGVLAAGASTTVTASVTTAANGFGLGTYNDTIVFSNTTNGAGNDSISAALDVINQVQVPQPPQSTTYAGLTRGYWFTAPATFVLTGLQVPPDASTGAQSIAVMKLTTTPPLYPSTTNSFTTLFITQNNPNTGIIPVTIPINQGDVIGILGWRGGVNSYGAAPYTTQILGQNVTLARFGMEYSLDSNPPQSVWTDTSTGYLGRVYMYITGTTGGPIITSAFNANANIGQSFQYQITATGNPTSYGATALPSGLTINPSTGIISGAPTATGATVVTISATNASGTGMASLTINVLPAPPTITSGLTATGTTSSSFVYQITATNNPTSFGATGLPSGLSLNTSTGLISGTPVNAGTTNVTISATNGGGTGSATLAITIAPGVPVITSSLSSKATINTAFSYSITASGSPTSYNAVGLPSGLGVNTSAGVISGTPTVLGTTNVTISATNGTGTGSATWVLTVAPSTPVITSSTSASGTIGSPFSYTITATNNPTSYNATSLPPGLSVNTGTGVINGTPTSSGTWYPTISATNSGGTGSASLTLTIQQAPPVITSPLTASAMVNGTFSYTITATASPYYFTATGVPSGLSLNSSTGVISGVPSATGTSNITIGAENGYGTGTATLVLTVLPAAPIITSNLNVNTAVNTAFTYQITAINNPTSYGAVGLPAGWSVNSSTGVITGTPTAAGTADIVISATNGIGVGTAPLTINYQTPLPPSSAFYYDGVGYIAGGGSQLEIPGLGYTFTATGYSGNTVIININGPNSLNWEVEMAAPGSAPLTVGTYLGATRYPFESGAAAGLTWAGQGRGDNQSIGAFNVLDIQFGSGTTITSFAADFVQFDELSTSEWNIGSIRYNSAVPITYPAPPVIISTGAAVASSTSEVISGIVNPAGPPTTAYFQFGTTTAYGNVTPSQSLLAGVNGVPISATLTGLQASTVYHYQFVATNAWGTSTGADATFTTGSAAPILAANGNASAVQGETFSYQILASNNPTSFAASGLPANLTINPATGLISGTATRSGTFPITLSASNSTGTGNATVTLTVATPEPAIVSNLTAAANLGSAFYYQIAATNSPTSYSASGLPAGLQVNTATGVISGTPTTIGSFEITLSATNGSGAGEAALILTVGELAPVVSFNSYTVTTGVPFSVAVSATNNPTSYSATGLPPGLSLNTSTGIISGTPTNPAFYEPNITATNAGGSGSSVLYINVESPPPVITSPLSATGSVGASFTYTITATNGPTSYSDSGLPAGLSLSSNVISGTPLVPGTFNVTISATNSGGTGNATLVLTIGPSSPIITSPLTVTAGVNVPFSYTIAATNAPTNFTASGLPSGLNLNSGTGVISGTVTTGGTANVVIGASNAVGSGTAMLTINFQTAPPAATAFYYNGVGYVSAGGSALETPGGGFTFSASKNYDGGVSISIGGNSTNWEIDTSAAGNVPLTLGSYPGATRYPFQGTGAPGLSWYGDGRGDNQSVGTFNVLDIQYGSGTTITSFAADFVQFDELSTSSWNIGSIRYNSTVPITFPAPPVIVSASASPLNLTSESLYAAVDPAGPPTTVYFQYGTSNAYGSTTPAQSLLAGVTGVPITGTLTGLQSSIIYHYRVVASNSWGTSMSADATFSPATSNPVIFSAANVAVTRGQPLSFQIQATNTPTGYAATGLPSGLTLNTTTGLISGTLNQAGTYPVTLSATNSVGTGTASLTITVNSQPGFSPSTLPPAYAGNLYQETVLVTGGTTPYTSLNISNFNPGTTGLTSSAITTNTSGTVSVSGTATAAGTMSFTANVTDASGATASANFTLVVNSALNPPVLQTLPLFVTGSTCTINWAAVTGATTYDVQAATSSGFGTIYSSETVSNTSATFSGLTNGTAYYYRARANTGAPANASSVWSALTSATQDATPPVVTITSPAASAYTTLGTATITGTATDTSGIASVTVNGIAATTANGFAQWSATVPLGSGENVVTAVVLDKAQPGGNVSFASVTIKKLQDTEGRGIPDAWKAANGLTGAAAGAMADPYHCGYCNLLAYAFNLAPGQSSNPPPVSTSQVINPGDGRPYLDLTYCRLIGAAQLTYTVEISTDLANWSSPAGQITQTGIVPAGDGTSEWVTVRIGPSIPQGKSLYGRVRVSSP